MQNNSNKAQHKGHKVSADLASLVATSKATVNDWSVMSKFLSSQDKEGVYTLQSFEQAMELISIPTTGEKKVVIGGKPVIQKICTDSLDLQQRRYETVRRTFYTFHAPNTGFPQYLDDLYQPVLTGEQELAILENRKSRDGVKKSYQTIHLANGDKKIIEHDIVKPRVSNFRNGYFNKIIDLKTK